MSIFSKYTSGNLFITIEEGKGNEYFAPSAEQSICLNCDKKECNGYCARYKREKKLMKENNMNAKDITERQKRLYIYLEQQKGYVTRKKIAEDLREIYFFGNCKNFETAKRRITEDIEKINISYNVEKVIIHCGNGVKLATKEEAYQYLVAKKTEAVCMLSDIEKIRKKIGLDKQIDIDGKTVEAFK